MARFSLVDASLMRIVSVQVSLVRIILLHVALVWKDFLLLSKYSLFSKNSFVLKKLNRLNSFPIKKILPISVYQDSPVSCLSGPRH